MKGIQNLIPSFVHSFFKSCEVDHRLNRYSFFLIRQDGVVLYNNNELDNKLDKSSVGALIGGVWQASKALSNFIPTEKTDEIFRLSFDTSSRGVYILPINVYEEELFLGLIYFDEVNPGLVKNKIRDLGNALTNYLESELKNNKKNNSNKKSDADYLFMDITDGEMDKIFSFIK
jgi:predicted regulator of Ras-like GTPase activity (Roadblock/LC7/MglB family)